jgi:2-polyprenyl-3-methyl-5-hydroxy-6-metoxy-1,4-benzoquinol methylase
MGVTLSVPRCLCGNEKSSLAFEYDAPPAGEIRFKFSSGENYFRQIFQCNVCGHFQSVHNMKGRDLYSGEYVDATYGDLSAIQKNFERITNLNPSQSDNVGRVRRVNEFASQYFKAPPSKSLKVLDVGSGLGVFVHRMNEAGWDCTALDPDKRAAGFVKEELGIRAICEDFFETKAAQTYNLVSFNKVLEHVLDPVHMLRKAHDFLVPGGLVYVELPDGEMACNDGKGREEFFIEHPHIFSMASLAILATKAGFVVDTIERLREPSTKYTLRAFLKA